MFPLESMGLSCLLRNNPGLVEMLSWNCTNLLTNPSRPAWTEKWTFLEYKKECMGTPDFRLTSHLPHSFPPTHAHINTPLKPLEYLPICSMAQPQLNKSSPSLYSASTSATRHHLFPDLEDASGAKGSGRE